LGSLVFLPSVTTFDDDDDALDATTDVDVVVLDDDGNAPAVPDFNVNTTSDNIKQ
jgi:predicted hotdog family 3-hydroxylacyl-ACP dehydratase